MSFEREHAWQKLSIERDASQYDQIMKLAAGFDDADMSWKERVKAATALHLEVSGMLHKSA
jgi:hypothetical protein